MCLTTPHMVFNMSQGVFIQLFEAHFANTAVNSGLGVYILIQIISKVIYTFCKSLSRQISNYICKCFKVFPIMTR